MSDPQASEKLANALTLANYFQQQRDEMEQKYVLLSSAYNALQERVKQLEMAVVQLAPEGDENGVTVIPAGNSREMINKKELKQ